MPKILLVTAGRCRDNPGPRPVVAQALVDALASHGFSVETLASHGEQEGCENAPGARLSNSIAAAEAFAVDALTADAGGLRPPPPPHSRPMPGVVLVAQLASVDRPDQGCSGGQFGEFLQRYDAILAQSQVEIVVLFDSSLAYELGSRAKGRGAAAVRMMGNLHDAAAALSSADAVIVPTQFAAEYCLNAYGVECTVLPELIDESRIRAENREPRYLTFVDPSYENGVYAFARIADELGRLRPDIPILVVEGTGKEQTLADCGLDLRRHGTVNLMGETLDPLQYWSVTRACILPSLQWQRPPRVAIEAMINGIPVIGSDRGAIPETLGRSGFALPLPERLTAATRSLPTIEEVSAWVEVIIRLWDDDEFYREQCRRTEDEPARWAPDALGQRYVDFFAGLKPGPRVSAPVTRVRAGKAVLVPHLDGIHWECEHALRGLEDAGIRVVRRVGCSAIDLSRNQLASEALHDGAEAVLFIDADVGFRPVDALKLLARPEPVVAGIYAKKGQRCLASRFPDEIEEVVFGRDAPGLYPLKYAGAGFLRIRTAVLRVLIEKLSLPLCNIKWGRGIWPFFQPMIVDDGELGPHYLAEDWAFCYRLHQVGITPLADTSIRLWHYGHHPFSWEDAGTDRPRYGTFVYRIHGAPSPEDR